MDAKQQCRIHEHFGEKVKPVICQLYPFGFRAISDRISVDVAFSCRAVSQGSGALVSEHVSEWAREIAERDAKAGPTPRLNARFPLSPEILWEMELHLGGLLGTRDLSVAQGAAPSRNAPLRLAPRALGAHLQRIGAAPRPAIPRSSAVETQLPLLTLPRWCRSRSATRPKDGSRWWRLRR